MAIAIRDLFRESVKEFGGITKVAKALGCSKTFVWYLGKLGSGKRPGRAMEKDIELLLKIPREWWDAIEKEKAATAGESE